MVRNKRVIAALVTGLSCAFLAVVSCGHTVYFKPESVCVSGKVSTEKGYQYAGSKESTLKTEALVVVREREKAEEMAKEQAEKEQKEQAEREKAEALKRAQEQEADRKRAEEEKAALERAAAEQAVAEQEQTVVSDTAVEQPVQEPQTAQPVTGTSQDQALLASIIFCEAGNQPYEGQVAVGAVIMNRIRSGSYPNSISEVIYQPGQFGPAMTGWLDQILSSGGYTDTAMQAALDAMSGVNPIGDCLYFGNGDYGMLIGDHYFH